MLRASIFMMVLLVCFGCNNKQPEQQQKVIKKDPVTLTPYSEPLPDSVLNRQFSYGAQSPEELGRAIINVLNEKDTLGLWNYAINKEEYLNWIWPEEPSSDPKFNIPLDFAWENLYRDSKKGLKVLMKKYGGKEIKFVSLTLPGKKIKHQTYTFHRDPELKITLPDGNEDVISEIGTIVEMNGLYKVLFYRKN